MREDRIRREASALWHAVFGEQPPPADDGFTLLMKLVQGAGTEHYNRLHSARLSDPTVVWPRSAPRRQAL